jgi:hypothetical protein
MGVPGVGYAGGVAGRGGEGEGEASSFGLYLHTAINSSIFNHEESHQAH